MRTRSTLLRKTLTSAGIAGLLTGSALFVAPGTAAAAVTSDCSTTVTGKMGDTVSISGTSVKEVVRSSAQKSAGLDNWFVLPDELARQIAEHDALAVGSIPRTATGSISGDKIGTVVAEALEDATGLGTNPEKTLAYISDGVADSCGLNLRASNYVAPTSATKPPTSTPRSDDSPAGDTPGSGSDGDGDGTSGSPSTTPSFKFGTGSAHAPRRDYGGLPFAVPGLSSGASTPGQLAPGAVPGFDGGLEPTIGDPAVDNAGNADVLAGPPADPIQLPMLLAVVALAGVGAALVRTWVLRRHHA